MESKQSRFVTKFQANFHKAIALISQTLGWLFLLGMGGAAMNDRGNTNWNGAIWGVLVCVYLIVIGRWAYRVYRGGETTQKSAIRVVRWLNLVSFVFFLLGIAFLIGNIIDPYLYRKLGLDL
ncbi:hypothetical protein ACH6CV_00700 [Bacillota bacterium Meth-B3]